MQNRRMKYLLLAFIACGCLHVDEPKQRTEWVSPPTKYGETTVQGQKDPSAPASSAEPEKKNPDDTAKASSK